MPATRPIDLSWIDEFIDNVRPFVFVREEDALIIKRPNLAQKLNPQGVRILKALLDGKRVGDLLDDVGREPRKIRDIALFMVEVKRFMEGRFDDVHHASAVEVRPFTLGFSTLPILSEIAVTYRCNLRCTFCYAGCNCTTNPVGDDREMSAAEIETVMRKIREDAQVPSISFTGGEATLRPDLERLIAYASGLGMRVNLITNGTRITPDRARSLARAGLDSAQVSLEGVTAETHERVTTIPHSFRRTVAAVSRLREAGIHVHTNTTICRDNVHEIERMPAFVRHELGNTKFSMNLVVPTGSAALHRQMAVRYSEIGPSLVRIANASRELGVDFMWYSPTPMCMFNPVAHGLGNKGCSACDGLLSVAANGEVLPCASYDEPVGNILNQPVLDIWRSKRATQFRQKFLAHPQCRSCEHFQICNGACPLYWREMGFAELCAARGFGPVEEEHFAQ